MDRKMLPLLGFLMLSLAAFAVPPRGGIFITRNNGYEGRIGLSHIFFERDGGVMSIVSGEYPKLETLAKYSPVFTALPKGADQPIEIRQEFDRAPEFLFLEEGNQRIALRVKYKLYDRAQTYLGHGMTETWIYPNGETFVTMATAFEGDRLEKVTEAYIEGKMATDYRLSSPAATPGTQLPMFNEENERYLYFSRQDAPGLSLYWNSKNKEYNTVIYRNAGNAPCYFRWPDYFCQAYYTGVSLDNATTTDNGIRIQWPLEGNPFAFSALFRIAAPVSETQTKAFVSAEQNKLKLAVTGGVIHDDIFGYNDLEGVYELRKNADPMTVILPADPSGRTIRVKAIALSKPGAVTAVLDGKPLVPHLVAEGGIADDPLAPIKEQPEGIADMALVTVTLTGKPQTLTFREVPGVQYAYQTRDTWRNFAAFTTKGGGRYAGFRFSLIDGHARNMRKYGRSDWALGENLLIWFAFCGYTPEQVLDQLRDFEILKNGPDEAIFRYVSVNSTEDAQSEFIVRVPADSPAMRMDVTATFTVLNKWPYTSSQFFDVFPFRGVWPQDWWYAETLWIAPNGHWKTRNTYTGKMEGDEKVETFSGGGFFALYSSDRGNMLMLTKNFKPDSPSEYVICGNYIDYHMNMLFHGADGQPAIPEKGFQASMQYELAVWGDRKLTRDQLIEIGKKSIKAGTLKIPAK